MNYYKLPEFISNPYDSEVIKHEWNFGQLVELEGLS